MPPSRAGAVLRASSRSRDTLSQVEDKLKLATEIPREILRATRSSLRVLKIRNPIGSFGRYDNDTKRACALLEYDVRAYNNDNDGSGNNPIEVTMEKLAKAAFMKLKDFREFHEKIGNFRENLRATEATTATVATTKRKDSAGTPASTEHRSGILAAAAAATTTAAGSKHDPFSESRSTISSLAIRLGAFVPNSSGVALRAQKFFRELVALLRDPSKKQGGVHGLRDVERNKSSYEAACFYLVATTAGRDDDNNNNNESGGGRRRRGSGGRFSKDGHHRDDEADDNRRIDLAALVNIAGVSPSQFQTILDYVRELRNEIESSQQSRNKCRASAPSADPTRSSTASRSPAHPGIPSQPAGSASRKRSSKEAFGGTRAATAAGRRGIDEEGAGDRPTGFFSRGCDRGESSSDETNDLDGNGCQRMVIVRGQRPFRSNATFEEWKSKVLREAREGATREMNPREEGNGDGFEKKKVSVEQQESLLDFVAREILARNGFL